MLVLLFILPCVLSFLSEVHLYARLHIFCIFLLFFDSVFVFFFFFFSSRRRHTRSLCDWSSDVCSSDLHHLRALRRRGDPPEGAPRAHGPHRPGRTRLAHLVLQGRPEPDRLPARHRSEERRVGKECRSRWSPDH